MRALGNSPCTTLWQNHNDTPDAVVMRDESKMTPTVIYCHGTLGLEDRLLWCSYLSLFCHQIGSSRYSLEKV